MDVLEASLGLGLLDALEPGPVTLGELAARHRLVPVRLYKLLDCLESLGLVRREQPTDALESARYQAVPGLRAAAQAVLGPQSLEKDRERYAWHELHGQLPQVLRGERSMPPPPSTGLRAPPSRWRASRPAWPRACPHPGDVPRPPRPALGARRPRARRRRG
ncbi:hypothetical protein QEG98_04215 [Myxococcus sp. MxC21-1]|uniref:methyltransferase family protein n=1 Tax=Myxococcus sp. MxC21-1 TaxID=3041439 RepID=UPI00292E2D64|nr:hypothetical protein [Myxococcus sp. MxC21-1]WNZ63010.1 hypothetical protein QEG98_04215 [Myxococcus sp. MxC21-1]